MASTVLSRTQANGTSSRIFTASIWFKRSPVTNVGNQPIWSSSSSTGDALDLLLAGNGEINFEDVNGNAPKFVTTRKLRDPSAWYHVVVAVDSTQATDTNRVKIYLNGVQETVFGTANYPTQNMDFAISTSADTMKFGSGGQGPSNYFNGLMSYVAFVDGTAYDASYFGETNAATGIWKINTSPSVTYGTNGCFLKMDTSSPGSDTSGNDNTFTASGTPTLAQDNASNNFTTFNPLRPNGISQTYSNGNNTVIRTGTGGQMNGTQGVTSGKWYYECLIDDYWQYLGWTALSLNTGQTTACSASGSGFYGLYSSASALLTYANGSGTGQGSYTPMASGQIWGIAFDADNAKMYFSVNGVWENSSDPANQTNPAMSSIPVTDFLVPAIGQGTGSRSSTIKMNFGNGFFGVTAVASSNADAAGHGLFEYAVPTGFFTLNTKNLNTYGG
jgi:hypothetical protein